MFEPDRRQGGAWLRPFLGSVAALSLAALSLAVLSACATQDDVQARLAPIDPQALGLQVDPARPAGAPQALDATWWRAYGDPQLDALVERALAGSPTMQVAQTRLQRVQALESYTRGNDKPQLQATGEVDRQHFSDRGMYPPPLAGASLTAGTLQLEGSWELDLFGRQRAELAAAVGQSRAAQADLLATRLWLSAQVADTYLHLGRLEALRALGARTLAQREDMLGLIRQRVQAGLDSTVELKQGEGALPDARVQIEALDEQITLARHALAVLTGQAPTALDTLRVDVDALRELPMPEHLPMDLLGRRADVMAARWRVEASGHQVDAARALFYPNVDLTSYAGFNAIGLDQLLKASSLQWGLLPAIHLPLFDGDRRRANLQGKVAEQDAAQASYNQTVLQAVQEAADGIASARSVARQRQQQAEALQSAEAAYRLSRERYQAGLGNYLSVLSAETAVLTQRRSAVDLRVRTLDTQFKLIRAMGGSLPSTTAMASQAPSAPTAPTPADSQPATAQAGDKS